MGLGPMEWAIATVLGVMIGGPIALILWFVRRQRAASDQQRLLLERLARLEAKIDAQPPGLTR